MKRYLADIDLSKVEILNCDVAIIGSGIAGLYAAYHLDRKLNCSLFTKQELDDSSSTLAQGGIAAVTEKADRIEYHSSDTITAGAGLSDKNAVRVIVEEGPGDIEELIKLGVNFDMDKKGHLMTAQEGGHGMRRILRCGGDATGAEIVEKLKIAVSKLENVELCKDAFVADIMTKDNEVCALIVHKDNKWVVYKTCNVIIAAGGIGQIYRYTTNPTVATGDGIAMAKRAGAKLNHMEFVQFHPTGFYTKENRNRRCFLISEALRGEGGKLFNDADERFMIGRHELAELAPRDIVSREIYREIKSQKSPFIKLDITHHSKKFLKKRFPTIYKACLDKGINISEQCIPVGPVQHYIMGGIKTDLDGLSNIIGLFAIGEAANTGVHGANRLASNSTLECVVFGRRCANYININFKNNDFKLCYPKIKKTKSNLDIEHEIIELKGIMVKYCGILRNEYYLKLGIKHINKLLEKLDNTTQNTRRSIELYNMVMVAHSILTGAFERNKSLGSHFREDEI